MHYAIMSLFKLHNEWYTYKLTKKTYIFSIQYMGCVLFLDTLYYCLIIGVRDRGRAGGLQPPSCLELIKIRAKWNIFRANITLIFFFFFINYHFLTIITNILRYSPKLWKSIKNLTLFEKRIYNLFFLAKREKFGQN